MAAFKVNEIPAAGRYQLFGLDKLNHQPGQVERDGLRDRLASTVMNLNALPALRDYAQSLNNNYATVRAALQPVADAIYGIDCFNPNTNLWGGRPYCFAVSAQDVTYVFVTGQGGKTTTLQQTIQL
ncbi:hypothetical protein ABBQ32_008725 [Trebouxia sp. C0010 RCD-2024]